MRAKTPVTIALCTLGLLMPGAVFAQRQEAVEAAEPAFAEDFEKGTLDSWAVDPKERQQASRVPTVFEIVRDGGKAALHLKGEFHNRVYLKDRTFKDFALTVRMKKTAGNYAGVVVRDHWRVYFQMKCFLCLNSDAKAVESKGELLKSGTAFPGYRELRVVCAGPLLHAYVDGSPVFKHQISPDEGRVGFYSHGNGEGYFDDVRIETQVAPEYYVLVEPEAPADGLVFSPDEGAKLRFKVSNFAAMPQAVKLSAAIKTWSGQPVSEPGQRQIDVGGGAGAVVEFDAGRIPVGFYRIELRASCAGKAVCQVDDLPLAVHKRESVAFRAPILPVAAYYKYFNNTSPVYRNTYAHAAARNLRDHHFNAVVADPSFTREVIDIFQGYGIATIARGQFLDHPAVIGTLTSDEPKPDEIEQLKLDYQKLRQTTDKPITTCMVGEGIGLGTPGDPVVMWRQLEPELRCFRWYGVKKSFYGILHDVKYKGILPLSSVLRIAEASSDTPYWFVPPALGKTDHEAYYFRPTPAETKGLMHLALAYGADGILFWAFQSHGSWPCFVAQQSLEPVDENYAAAAEVAAKVAAHAVLVKSLEHIGLDIRCPSPVVDAVPRINPKDGKFYVYAVNKDTKHAVATKLLLWADTWALRSMRDVYAGDDLKIERDEEGYWSVPLSLAPGEGKLLATDAENLTASKAKK